jgi:hypothetical protein
MKEGGRERAIERETYKQTHTETHINTPRTHTFGLLDVTLFKKLFEAASTPFYCHVMCLCLVHTDIIV